MDLNNKRILVTGASGMVGLSLVKQLIDRGYSNNLILTDIISPHHSVYNELISQNNIPFIQADLCFFNACLDLTKDVDVIFNVIGIKGSPDMARTKPASFMSPMLQFNTNMITAAMINDVDWFLYTSSVGVYQPAEIFNEDDVWSTFPSPNDKFPGWTKRMGELLIEAYSVQNGRNNTSIIRPGNIYGAYDNFDERSAMVIPSLISKAHKNDVLEVFGDGKPIRDFVYADDVARGMIFAVENEITEPLNLSSGKEHSIKDVVDLIVKYSDKELEVKWLTEYASGDSRRLMNIDRIKSYGFEPEISLEDGIRQTIDWYRNNQNIVEGGRFDPFHK